MQKERVIAGVAARRRARAVWCEREKDHRATRLKSDRLRASAATLIRHFSLKVTTCTLQSTPTKAVDMAHLDRSTLSARAPRPVTLNT